MGKTESEMTDEKLCQLFLALAFSCVLFPNKNSLPKVFYVLDDLEKLDEYVWGEEICDFLVDGLNRAHADTTSSTPSVKGCTPFLESWATSKGIKGGMTKGDSDILKKGYEKIQIAVTIPKDLKKEMWKVQELKRLLDKFENHSSGDMALVFFEMVKCEHVQAEVGAQGIDTETQNSPMVEDSPLGDSTEKLG